MPLLVEREFFIDNLLVRIHHIIVMITWTGLAPWEFEFPFPGRLTSTLLSSGETFKPFAHFVRKLPEDLNFEDDGGVPGLRNQIFSVFLAPITRFIQLGEPDTLVYFQRRRTCWMSSSDLEPFVYFSHFQCSFLFPKPFLEPFFNFSHFSGRNLSNPLCCLFARQRTSPPRRARI